MEGQAPDLMVETIVAPSPIALATTVAPVAQVTTQAPQNYEDGGVFEGRTKSKWKMVDIFIMSLWIIAPIYIIMYNRKAIKKLDEQPTVEEFETMVGDIEEVRYNLKKELGDKYKNI
jgi:hypothetical protein